MKMEVFTYYAFLLFLFHVVFASIFMFYVPCALTTTHHSVTLHSSLSHK